MKDDEPAGEAPLKAEAAKRAEWRGDEGVSQDPRSTGHTLATDGNEAAPDRDESGDVSGPGRIPFPPD